MDRNDLIRLAILYKDKYSSLSQAVEKNEKPPNIPLEKAITILDKEYPNCLRFLENPPWVLFYEGNIELLDTPMITIIGSRNVSEYGKQATKIITNILKRKYTTVSGLAKGVDGLVHESSLYKGHTIGVIGSGLNIHYPKCNEFLYQEMVKNHLILSEYPKDTNISKDHFPWRNRILAALGKATIVTEADVKSGTMLTVNEAMNLSKDVYVVPYPYQDNYISGCNKLINDGAMIIYSRAQLYSL